ncbi:MAG TPA: site-2 protease family protein [Pedococcus sp.]|jgi:Zn-dependent protease|uniref:site-2 protease family protein n=1 Tax=Pedococcus sp. TaxID=2860345 RepID=UPI002F93A537
MEPSQRRPGLRVGSVAGVPVFIGGSWVVIALVLIALIGPSTAAQRPDLGVLAYGVGAFYAVMLLAAILVHEAAHALAARAFGLPVLRIVADLWGGHTAFEAGRSTPRSSAVIAAVGPLSNAALALLAWVALPVTPGGIPNALVEGFAVLNAALAAFNLLPGLPLDGGQLVESAVWGATGSRPRGMVVAGWCGRAVTAVVFAWFLGRPLLNGRSPDVFDLLWALFIASFMWAGASAAIRGGQALAAVNQVPLAQVLRPALPAGADERLDAVLARWTPGQAVVVFDGQGQPVALVDPEAVGHVPPARYAETGVGAVSSPQPRGWSVESDPGADIVPVVTAMQTVGAPLVAVTHQGRFLGVVSAADVNRALERL